MRFATQGLLSLAALSVATGAAARATNAYQLHARTSTDVCGDVNDGRSQRMVELECSRTSSFSFLSFSRISLSETTLR